MASGRGSTSHYPQPVVSGWSMRRFEKLDLDIMNRGNFIADNESTFSRIPAAQPRAAALLEFDWLNTKRSKSLDKQRAVCNSNSSRNSLRGT